MYFYYQLSSNLKRRTTNSFVLPLYSSCDEVSQRKLQVHQTGSLSYLMFLNTLIWRSIRGRLDHAKFHVFVCPVFQWFLTSDHSYPYDVLKPQSDAVACLFVDQSVIQNTRHLPELLYSWHAPPTFDLVVRVFEDEELCLSVWVNNSLPLQRYADLYGLVTSRNLIVSCR